VCVHVRVCVRVCVCKGTSETDVVKQEL
jgi:hypothetical protein